MLGNNDLGILNDQVFIQDALESKSARGDHGRFVILKKFDRQEQIFNIYKRKAARVCKTDIPSCSKSL
ncbi:hypothetical protein SAMN06265368_2558 [Cohaesibacter gelatinilyticus]|uniref:Uncharacterized protein n=1 Tax=Cohaesibacter gelatinilyticus TaxID=372072 RepID=A0A285PCJ8_9HYPH|nr:hypothetical protein SAMN06265368_2558 [Cohaesibacter gelatinilyticus]